MIYNDLRFCVLHTCGRGKNKKEGMRTKCNEIFFFVLFLRKHIRSKGKCISRYLLQRSFLKKPRKDQGEKVEVRKEL